jgi:FMN phosphatase YigB (HAD superfamily)
MAINRTKDTLLFDLEGTLVHSPAETGGLREALVLAVAEAQRALAHDEYIPLTPGEMLSRIETEAQYHGDGAVRPLRERLISVFGLPDDVKPHVLDAACAAFTKSILARVFAYKDVIPALHALKARGYRLGVLANVVWGTPAGMWREKLERIGLGGYFEEVVFCGDAGVCVPHAAAFKHALNSLEAYPEQCVYIGGHNEHLQAAAKLGIDSVLVSRNGSQGGALDTVRTLLELPDLMKSRGDILASYRGAELESIAGGGGARKPFVAMK